tara:strand:+ start:780 stop:1871 length:1092 start_codon:yes stop_codon:yes gene_type:complete
MASNNRIFYACQAVFVDGSYLHNVQAVGLDYGADITALSDTGRTQRQINLYSKPEITITLQREIDSGADPFYSPLLHNSYEAAYILKPGNIGTCGWDTTPLKEYDIEITYGGDDLSGAVDYITLKYCLLTEISYSLDVGGRMTEDLTFVTKNLIESGSASPPYLGESGTLLRGADLDIRSKDGDGNLLFKLPTEVKNIVDITEDDPDGGTISVARAVQSISASVNLDYGELTDVGKWRGSDQSTNPSEQNKWRYITTPISVDCEINAVVRKSVQRDILMKDTNFMTTFPTSDREIRIVVGGGETRFVIDLGSKNHLTSIGFSGGDTGGGNVEASFSYSNTNNDFVAYRESKAAIPDLTQTTTY